MRPPPQSAWPLARPPRLLFIASRPARDTTSGPLILHRHLAHVAPRFDISRAHLVESPRPDDAPCEPIALSALYRRARASRRLARWADALDLTLGFAVSRRRLHALFRRHRPDLVLTVAEPPVFLPLVSVARACGVPLVSIVHDWAPVWMDIPRKTRPFADRRFARDCRAATLTLSVSDELAARLGGGPRQRVLHPLPGPAPRAPGPPDARFHALYAGVFHYFHGEEMNGLCAELLRRGRPDLLRIVGLEPDWSRPGLSPVKAGGFHAGFLPRPALARAFDAAGALLIICPFSPGLDAFARYSFPSKLTEYTQHHRPLLLWAPPWSAAAAWARRHDAALVVADPSPAALADALLRLEADPALRADLARAAGRAAAAFSPDVLNARFEESLWDALRDSSLPAG